LSESERIALARDGHPGAPGLFGGCIAEYLWEHQVAAVAVDNPAMEASHRGRGIDDSLHVELIARLGMPIGELWRLGPLAEDCAEDGCYTCLLCSAPLAIGGAAGSPANALAIK
jgi:kynurenine formamidase